MADSSSYNNKLTIEYRILNEHRELGYQKKIIDQAENSGMKVNDFARKKLFESLDDDRLDHLTALIDQLHSKVRNLEQNADRARLDQKKGLTAILVQLCNISPEEASRIVGGDAPL